MTIAAKLVKGSVFRTVSMLLSMVISFFMMPYVVQSLGDRLYGLWVVVGAATGYYALLDLGLSSAVTRFISRAMGSGDRDQVREITSTSFYIYSALACVALAATGVLAAGAGWFVRAPEDVRLLRILILLVGVDFALSMPVRVFNGTMNSGLRFDVVTTVDMTKTVATACLVLGALKAGWGVIGIAAAQFLWSTADNALRIVCSYRGDPAPSVSPRYFRLSRVRVLFSYSAYTFASRLADVLRFRIDAAVIAGFLGAARVTHYFIAARLVDYFMKLMSSVMGVMLPVFSRYDGSGDSRNLQEKFLLTTKISVVLSVFFAGTCLFLGKPFIEIWMGPEYLDAYPVLAVLVTATTLDLMQSPSVNLLYGISKHKFYTYSNSAEGLLNLVLSLALVERYGILGVAMGTAVPMALTKVFVQPVYVCRAAGIPYRKYMAHTSGALARSVLAFALPCAALRDHMAGGYAGLVSAGAVLAAAYVPLVILLVFDKSEWQTLGLAFSTFRRRSYSV
ncbi:MAG: lipopolysaccharide biosynthesis protein [Elusimicrobiota bacterium]